MRRPLYPLYLLQRRLGGPQNQSGWGAWENILDPIGTQIWLGCPARSQSLSRLLSKQLSSIQNTCLHRIASNYMVFLTELILGSTNLIPNFLF
jgi:hypothetical protein